MSGRTRDTSANALLRSQAMAEREPNQPHSSIDKPRRNHRNDQ
jgi:hypothetical protein